MIKIKSISIYFALIFLGVSLGLFLYHLVCLYIEPKLISFPFKDIKVVEKSIISINRDRPCYQFYIIEFNSVSEALESLRSHSSRSGWYERKKPFPTFWPFRKEMYKDQNRVIFINKQNDLIMACQVLPDSSVICLIRYYDKEMWDHAEESIGYIREQFE